MKNVILDKTLRDVWYNSHVHKGTKDIMLMGQRITSALKPIKGLSTEECTYL